MEEEIFAFLKLSIRAQNSQKRMRPSRLLSFLLQNLMAMASLFLLAEKVYAILEAILFKNKAKTVEQFSKLKSPVKTLKRAFKIGHLWSLIESQGVFD